LVSNYVYPCIGYFSDLFVCRTTNSSFYALLFQKKGLFQLIWPPLYLKPPRLKKIRTEMKPKNRKKIPPRRHRLLLRFLKTLVQTRRGSDVDELTSSSTSVQRTAANEAPVLEEGFEFFDLMAS
jgi:hypothetical protein